MSNDLENLQKRAMRIIQPNSSYSEILKELDVPGKEDILDFRENIS